MSRSSPAGRPVSLVFLALVASACATAPTRAEVKAQLHAGAVSVACAGAKRLLDGARRRASRLDALRLWIGCLAATGRQARAERWLKTQPASGATRYAEALLAVSRWPARLDRALTSLRGAARAWPDQSEIPLRAGVVLASNGDSQAALVFFRRAWKLEHTARCAVAYAHALVDVNRLGSALELARAAVELRPSRADVRRGEAVVQRIARRQRYLPARVKAGYRALLDTLVKLDQPARALQKAQALIADHPNIAVLHTLLGLCHLKLDNAANAVAALRRAMELDRRDPVNYLYLASLHQRAGREDKAIALYRLALRYDPFSQRAALALGRLLRDKRSYGAAARVFERLIAIEGASGRSLRLAGRSRLKAGSLRLAQQRFERLLQAEPKDFEAHLRLAQIYRARSKREKVRRRQLLAQAKAHAEVAAERRPKDPELVELRRWLRAQ